MRALCTVPLSLEDSSRQIRLSPCSLARSKWVRNSSGVGWLVVGRALASPSIL